GISRIATTRDALPPFCSISSERVLPHASTTARGAEPCARPVEGAPAAGARDAATAMTSAMRSPGRRSVRQVGESRNRPDPPKLDTSTMKARSMVFLPLAALAIALGVGKAHAADAASLGEVELTDGTTLHADVLSLRDGVF